MTGKHDEATAPDTTLTAVPQVRHRTVYLTRNLYVDLLDRMRTLAAVWDVTIEAVLNVALEVGLDRLQKVPRGQRTAWAPDAPRTKPTRDSGTGDA